MSATPVSQAEHHLGRELFEKVVKAHIKARSRIVKVLGDMYYEELSEKDVLDT